MAFAKQKLSPKITAAPLLLAKKVSFFPPPPSYTKTYYIHTSFYVPLSFSQLFFLLPQLCEGGRAFYFWSSVLLHTTYIYTHYYYWESLLFLLLAAVLCSHLSSLSDSYQETESAFHPTFFPWLQGEKTYKGESHFGKTLLGFDLKKFRIIHFIWDSPFFFFYFLSHVPFFYQNE